VNIAGARRIGGSAGVRMAIGVLVGTLLIVGTPGATLANSAPIKLALLPIDQPGSFFDLTMAPGDHRTLEVEIANDGVASLAVRTYAADVYTIVNGGFGGRLRDQPETGATRWLTYPQTVITLAAGQRGRRSFTVAVPPATAPGEYIASLVLENDQPLPGEGTVALDQVVRQAVAVVVTVPGERSPALAIGSATHQVVNGLSVIDVAIDNIGNIRLAPVASFTLLDTTGALVSHTTLPMGTFYAGTSTSIEVPLAALLQPGTYTVRLALADAAQDARAEAEVPLVIAGPATTVAPAGSVPGLVGVNQDGADALALLPWILAGVAVLLAGVLAVVVLALGRRSRRRPADQE
jgi:hypothetical protein